MYIVSDLLEYVFLSDLDGRKRGQESVKENVENNTLDGALFTLLMYRCVCVCVYACAD